MKEKQQIINSQQKQKIPKILNFAQLCHTSKDNKTINKTASRERERERESYTEATSGGEIKEGSGNFSSIIPTITSESGTHLSSNFATGTFPSGLISKNLIPIPK